jgi:hypothetical protein
MEVKRETIITISGDDLPGDKPFSKEELKAFKELFGLELGDFVCTINGETVELRPNNNSDRELPFHKQEIKALVSLLNLMFWRGSDATKEIQARGM